MGLKLKMRVKLKDAHVAFTLYTDDGGNSGGWTVATLGPVVVTGSDMWSSLAKGSSTQSVS